MGTFLMWFHGDIFFVVQHTQILLLFLRVPLCPCGLNGFCFPIPRDDVAITATTCDPPISANLHPSDRSNQSQVLNFAR
jgi:hypothetical protein